VLRGSLLQAEIQQRRPFSSSQQEGVLGILRTADVVRRRLATAVEPRGLTLQQYNVLRILRGAGEDGLPTLDIGARMIEEAPGITRLLDRLERKRLVRRRRGERDRRRVLCTIAPSGLALLADLDPVVRNLNRHVLGDMAEPRVRRLVRLLDAVRREHARSATQAHSSSSTRKVKKEKRP
jgi:DNA-binding MarR family transcriptional regulator